MTSAPVETQGSQRPRLCHLPPGKVGSSGSEVVEFAASAGLILDDWQAWVLAEALAERLDGKWSAFEVCLLVARQNGKGSILEALEVFHLFILRSPLVVHSAHEFKTCREHFLRMQRLIRASDELWDQVRPGSGGYIHTGAGSEEIGTADGCRMRFVARSRGSGRGFTGDLVVLDEAYDLPAQAIGAMLPTLAARPNPQVWYTSSAPQADSEVLHKVRARGVDGNAGRLFLAEWGNEPGTEDSDEARARANPARGIRISDEFMDDERDAMEALGTEWGRERLGIPDAPDLTSGVFPPGTWGACLDERSRRDGKVSIALDVGPDMKWASFALAGTRADGLVHVELMERHPGTVWVLERAKHYTAEHGPLCIDPRSPVAGLLEAMTKAKVPLLELPDGQLPRACAMLQEKVLTGTVRHIGQSPLDNVVAGAAIRTVGDAWRWSRGASQVDISPLVAVTEALWAAQQAKGAPHFYTF